MNFQKIKHFMSVSMPFMLVFVSFCMLLIVGICGLPRDFMGSIFSVETKNLAINPSNFASLTNINVTGRDNLTALSLRLSDKYTFYLWNFATKPCSKTKYHSSNFDYVDKIKISKVTVDGVSYDLPKDFVDVKKNLRNEIQFGQMAFLACTFNAFLVLLVGILACFSIKFRAMVTIFFNVITLLTMIVFAALITAAGLGTTGNGDLKKWKEFGVKVETGAVILGIVWVAVIHMLVVCVMWALMLVGVVRMNPAVKEGERGMVMGVHGDGDEELVHNSSGGSYHLLHVTPKHN